MQFLLYYNSVNPKVDLHVDIGFRPLKVNIGKNERSLKGNKKSDTLTLEVGII